MIEPLLNASGARVVVEVGTGDGETTALLLAWAARFDAVIHSIDPSPGIDPTAWQREHGERFHFHRVRSLDVLAEIDCVDVALIDGDHNWYTVRSELSLLAKRAEAERHPLPLIIAHDAGWPYARRDMYYDPASVPSEHRHDAAREGIHPGRSQLETPGFNARLMNATREGGARNGVLTAIEDFADEHPGECRVVGIPGAGGLAVLADRRRLEASSALVQALERLESPHVLRNQISAVDELRVHMEIRLRAAQAENARLVRARHDLEARLSGMARAVHEIGSSRTWRAGNFLARALRLLTFRRPVPSEGPAELARRIEVQSKPRSRYRRRGVTGPAAEKGRIEVPEHLTRERVERTAREFTRVYRDLKDQTFKATTWLGVPIVKSPNEIVAAQEIITETLPELIIETGVSRGGGTLLFASVQELLGIEGRVIGIDTDLSRVDDRVRGHPGVELIEGSSTDPHVVAQVRAAARGRRVMVDLDSDHAADHVLSELHAYAPLVSPGCYLIVEDTFVGGRPVLPDLTPGPTEALDAWLAEGPSFEIDRWPERFLLTQNPRGYLRRIDPKGRPPRRPAGYVIGSLERAVAEEDAAAEGTLGGGFGSPPKAQARRRKRGDWALEGFAPGDPR